MLSTVRSDTFGFRAPVRGIPALLLYVVSCRTHARSRYPIALLLIEADSLDPAFLRVQVVRRVMNLRSGPEVVEERRAGKTYDPSITARPYPVRQAFVQAPRPLCEATDLVVRRHMGREAHPVHIDIGLRKALCVPVRITRHVQKPVDRLCPEVALLPDAEGIED